MTLSRLKTKLESPVALVVQGFVAGCILFWTVAPGKAEAQAPVAQVQAHTHRA